MEYHLIGTWFFSQWNIKSWEWLHHYSKHGLNLKIILNFSRHHQFQSVSQFHRKFQDFNQNFQRLFLLFFRFGCFLPGFCHPICPPPRDGLFGNAEGCQRRSPANPAIGGAALGSRKTRSTSKWWRVSWRWRSHWCPLGKGVWWSYSWEYWSCRPENPRPAAISTGRIALQNCFLLWRVCEKAWCLRWEQRL